jgi:hypothetical protein
MRIFKHKITIIGLTIFMCIVGLVGEAIAQVQAPRPNVVDGGNRWLITYYNDCDTAHTQWATQGICFLPYKPCGACGIQGSWYSDTYPGWRGRYMQEGDRILMHGNWAKFGGSDGIVIDLFAGTSPRDEGAGQWTEWLNSGQVGLPDFFGNTRLRRVGKCQLATNADISRMSQVDMDRMAMELSDRVKPRMRRDGKQAESPTDPEQVPLAEEKEYQPR